MQYLEAQKKLFAAKTDANFRKVGSGERPDTSLVVCWRGCDMSSAVYHLSR